MSETVRLRIIISQSMGGVSIVHDRSGWAGAHEPVIKAALIRAWSRMRLISAASPHDLAYAIRDDFAEWNRDIDVRIDIETTP